MFLAGSQKLQAMAGPRRLLDQITVSLHDGDRIGILGPNGAGKSTLLRLLTGLQEPDGGNVTLTNGIQISTLSQSDDFGQAQTIRQAIQGEQPDYLWQTDRKWREIAAGLLVGIDLETPIGQLSGGQRRRVALARTLASPAQILALDEPTNHLDLEGVAWLANHLQQRFPAGKGALLVVTHDRWFLDEVCNTIWEVVPGVDPGNVRPQIPGRVEIYEGAYAAYILARAERARQAATAEAKRQNLLRKELAWLRRGAPARTSKPRFRIAAAEALIENTPPPRDKVELLRLASARLGKRVIELEDVSFHYPVNKQSADRERLVTDNGQTRNILNQITWRLAPADRIGIIGINGAGKSTLLRILQGRLEPTSGTVLTGKTVQIGVLDQYAQMREATAGDRVVEALSRIKERISIGDGELSAQQLVERLGFSKERAWTPLDQLSGGEKRRVQLAAELLREPNVLLLDEPTNDLDTDTLAQLEDLLDGFPGTIVVVSHDRYLLQRVTDRQLALLPTGQLVALPGGVEQYLELRQTGKLDQFAASLQGHAVGDLPGQQPLPGYKNRKSAGTVRSDTTVDGERVEKQKSVQKPKQKTGAQKFKAAKQLNSLENKLGRLEEKKTQIEEEMAQVASDLTPSGLEKLQRLDQEYQVLQEQIAEVEMAWLELGDQLDI